MTSVDMNLRALIAIGEDANGEPQVICLGNTANISGLLGNANQQRRVAVEAPVTVSEAPTVAKSLDELKAEAKAMGLRGAHFSKDAAKLQARIESAKANGGKKRRRKSSNPQSTQSAPATLPQSTQPAAVKSGFTAKPQSQGGGKKQFGKGKGMIEGLRVPENVLSEASWLKNDYVDNQSHPKAYMDCFAFQDDGELTGSEGLWVFNPDRNQTGVANGFVIGSAWKAKDGRLFAR